MGNRAVIAYRRADSAPCIYVHWNGGRASIEAFLAAARDLGVRHITARNEKTVMAQLHRIIGTYLGGSVYLETHASADRGNWDNGVYYIGRDLNIARREFTRGPEEINPEKTAAIHAAIVSRAAHFND